MRCILCYVILFFNASAWAVQSIDQPFAEINLTDGRVLTNAKLKSFNSTSVFVKSDEGIAQVRYELFPKELQSQLTSARINAAAGDNSPPPLSNSAAARTWEPSADQKSEMERQIAKLDRKQMGMSKASLKV